MARVPAANRVATSRRLMPRNMGKSLATDFSDYMTIPLKPDHVNGFGFAIWVMPRSVYNGARILAIQAPSAGGFQIICAGTTPSRCDFTVFNSAGGAVTAFSVTGAANLVQTILKSNTWMHIGVRYSPNNVSFYVNGLQIGSTDTTAEMGDTGSSLLTFGRHPNVGGTSVRARFDDLMFVNGRMPSENEILNHYYKGQYPSDASCVIEFNDSLVDETGNGNSGTLTGTAVYSTNVPLSARPSAEGHKFIASPQEGGMPVVNISQFGALGNGVIDDTVSFQRAVDSIRAAGRGVLQLNPGDTYLIRSVAIQQGLVLEGRGAIIKRPDMIPNWVRTMTTEGRLPEASSSDSLPIVIRNITFDGNLANQGPYDSYQLEQSPLLLIRGNNTGSGRQPLLVEDVTFTGSVSDGVHVVDNVDATLRNIRATDCFRGGITITGGHTKVDVDGFLGDGDVCGAHIDVEIDSPGYGGSKSVEINMSNVEVAPGTSTGKMFQITLTKDSASTITLSDLTCRSGAFFDYAEGSHTTVSNSVFHVSNAGERNRIFLPGTIVFNNCEFIVQSHPQGGPVIDGLEVQTGVQNQNYDFHPNAIIFNSCSWSVGTIAEGDSVRAAVYTELTSTSPDRYVAFNDCTISGDFPLAVKVEHGGTIIVDGVVMPPGDIVSL